MVQGDVALREETIPLAKWETGVAGTKAGDKVVFKCLDGTFRGIAAVAVGGNALEINFIFGECGLEIGGAFVVKDVEIGGVAVLLQFLKSVGPCGG